MKKLLLILPFLLLAAMGARAADNIAQAIWCSSNNTLYFDYCGKITGSTYSGQAFTSVFPVPTDTYPESTYLGWQKDDDVKSNATTVVFTEAFKNFKPKCCLGWFKGFAQLATITGLSNLDTSEVTDMDNMFENCFSLVTIDVNTFDVSSVTSAQSMFIACKGLTTIYCNKTWSIVNTTSMFGDCSKLKGAVKYNSSSMTGDMATPKNGYFTARVSLSDEVSDATDLTTYSGYYGDVTLSGLTLYKDGNWNTLCLPFDVTVSGSPLADASIKQLDEYNTKLSGGKLTLRFTNADETILAGTPVIVKWEATGENIEKPVFKGVTISEQNNAKTITTSDSKVKFVGQFAPFAITASNINDILYIGSGNKVGYAKKERTLKRFHAHFEVPADAGARVRAVSVIDFGDTNDTTGISTLICHLESGDDYWYTIDGRRLSGEPARHGLYIYKGVVVKK